jgi:hypothetical protein
MLWAGVLVSVFICIWLGVCEMPFPHQVHGVFENFA